MAKKSFVGIVKLTKKQNEIIIRNCYAMERNGYMHNNTLYPDKKCSEIRVTIDKSNKTKNCHIRNITDGMVVSFDTYYQNQSDKDFKVTNIARWTIKNTKWDMQMTEKLNLKFARMIKKAIKNNAAHLVGTTDEIYLTDLSENVIKTYKKCLEIADEHGENITLDRLEKHTAYSKKELEKYMHDLCSYHYLSWYQSKKINKQQVAFYKVNPSTLENFKVASNSINDVMSASQYIGLHSSYIKAA